MNRRLRIVKLKKICIFIKFPFGILSHKVYLIEAINFIASKINYCDKYSSSRIWFPAGQILALSRN